MKRRYFMATALLLALCVLCLFGAYNLHMALSGGLCSMNPSAVLAGVQIRNVRLFWYMGCAGSLLAVVWMMVSRSYIKYRSDMQKITPDIEVPKAEGQGQYGTAHWLDPKRFPQVFAVAEVKDLAKLREGGIVLGQSKDGRHIYYTGEDTHAFVIGATRSGKSRTVVLPTIGLLGMAGESMVTVDPKAELYTYTYPFLEAQGYEVITIDFDSPGRSNRYNFLQPVIDAVNAENVALAVTKARDISAMLVQDSGHTDPLWPNGQRSVLTASILAVVVDNQRHPEFQNLANAQQFMVNMCKPFGKYGDIPLAKYLQNCPPEHPARIAMGTAEIAPSKMRGSFYTSAATTLDLFTDPAIHAMTSETDWDIYATGQRKRAIFIILPDERSTYYPLAALFVYQHYQTLVGVSKQHGNRLPH
ncbi:MAG: type IV secretory system conjugative DNA transfer family protein, partial [Oscillospiraceae bacterium]